MTMTTMTKRLKGKQSHIYMEKCLLCTCTVIDFSCISSFFWINFVPTQHTNLYKSFLAIIRVFFFHWKTTDYVTGKLNGEMKVNKSTLKKYKSKLAQ